MIKDKQAKFIDLIQRKEPQIEVKLNHPLAPYTSLKLGGPADIFIEPKTIAQLVIAWSVAHQFSLPTIILGSGTNVLISDKGFRGVVILNKISEINITKRDKTSATIQATSGALLSNLVKNSVEAGFQDLLPFFTIPGTVGGAVWNNAHYRDLLLGSFITQVTAVDKKGQIHHYSSEELELGYDHSRFQNSNELILSASFKLSQPLKNKEEGTQLLKSYLKYRITTQPQGVYSTGCIFKNLNPETAKKLGLPSYHTGFLIDKTGLKGKKIGGAVVSEKHANFIVHKGQATAKDFYQLIQLVKKEVKRKYGCQLQEEVKLIGFD